jgi:hypothetical protein
VSATYVERDCTVTFEGRTFESGGAFVSDAHIVAYPADGGVLQDWHGNAIGTWRATSSWRTPRSFVSSRMYAIRAHVDGRTYVGRGAGVGMIFRGRRVARELREVQS